MWEYSDEKLEDWILATKGETVIFDHLGSIPEIQGKSVDDDKIYRLYDPATRILYFRGSGFSLPALADAIADVYKRVVPLHRQLLPDQYPDASEALEVKTDDQPDKPERPANKKGKAKRPPKKTSVAKKTRKSSKRSAPKSSTAQ